MLLNMNCDWNRCTYVGFSSYFQVSQTGLSVIITVFPDEKEIYWYTSDFSGDCIDIFALKISISVWIKPNWTYHPKILFSISCCPTSCTLTGGWVGGEVLNHASLHDWDPPATQDNSIYCNDTCKHCSQIINLITWYLREQMCQFFHCQSPVTVLCPSVRLLQKSSTVDISSMICRWKPDSLFHQSCQCAMSWELCTQVICHYLVPWLRTWLALLNCTCKIFSASSSSLAAWTLNFRFSYCRIAAAPNEQPVNWQKIQCCHTVPKLCSCVFSNQCMTGGTYPHCEHQWFQKRGSWGFGKRCGTGFASLRRGLVCFFQDISFLCIWSFGFSTEATPLLFVVTQSWGEENYFRWVTRQEMLQPVSKTVFSFH